MKKTKFKLIINSDSYRIYVNDGIEYCRFKKKYYPLDEIENVINSYKIGGVPGKTTSNAPKQLQVTDVLFLTIIIAIIENLTIFNASNTKIIVTNTNIDKYFNEIEINKSVNTTANAYAISLKVITLIIIKYNIKRDILNVASDIKTKQQLNTNYNNFIVEFNKDLIPNNASINSAINNRIKDLMLKKINSVYPKENAKVTKLINLINKIKTGNNSFDFTHKFINCSNTNIFPIFKALQIINNNTVTNKFTDPFAQIGLQLLETIEIYKQIKVSISDLTTDGISSGSTTSQINKDDLLDLIQNTHKLNTTIQSKTTIISEELQKLYFNNINTYNIIIIKLEKLSLTFFKLKEFVSSYTNRIIKDISMNDIDPYMLSLANAFFDNFNNAILNIIYLTSFPTENFKNCIEQYLKIITLIKKINTEYISYINITSNDINTIITNIDLKINSIIQNNISPYENILKANTAVFNLKDTKDTAVFLNVLELIRSNLNKLILNNSILNNSILNKIRTLNTQYSLHQYKEDVLELLTLINSYNTYVLLK